MGEIDARITRRAALGAFAGVGAAGLLRPSAGLGAATRVFGQAVGRLFGSSIVVAAPRRFELVGVQWRVPERPRIELRARRAGGSWSAWAPASVLGHGPDSPDHELIGEGIWTGPADQVELRSPVPVEGVRLHYVAVGEAQADRARIASAPLAQPVLDAGPGQPPIIARQVWAAGHAPRVLPVGYGTVKLAFVHHTVNPNGYSAGEVPAMLYAMYQYHRFVRGFFDIAYNFVIDLFGRIWEARAGGIDEAVVGAQAGGYNQVSTGVAILGTFMDVLPSQAALAALERLLAWKLSLHGIPTDGHVTVRVNPADAFYTPFPPGAHVSLPRVAGHRDGDLTDCPGNALYAHLPAIRPRVTALAGAPLQLALSAHPLRVSPGTPVALSGALSQLGGAPAADAQIELQQIGRRGGETTFQYLATASDGTFGATLAPTRTTQVRALHRAAPAAVSDIALIEVRRRRR